MIITFQKPFLLNLVLKRNELFYGEKYLDINNNNKK